MTTINIRVEEQVKKQAMELFDNLGLDMSTALNIFLRKAISYGGIPFELTLTPNAETIEAIEEVEKIKRGEIKAKGYRDINELFADLESEEYDKV